MSKIPLTNTLTSQAEPACQQAKLVSSSDDKYSQLLYQAYDQFMLPLGGKKIPTPYHRNKKGSYQKPKPQFQGKSSARTILKTAQKLAQDKNFDFEKATTEEIRQFLTDNKLGIDCSGFIYRMLDYLVQKLGKGNLQQAAGVEHIGRTNVAKLTSDEFSVPVENFDKAQAGDIIRLNSADDILHGVLILDKKDGVITYAHSSSVTNPSGVHQGQIIDGQLPEELQQFLYQPEEGDGIRRLKALV
jgi:hypothetical protein